MRELRKKEIKNIEGGSIIVKTAAVAVGLAKARDAVNATGEAADSFKRGWDSVDCE